MNWALQDIALVHFIDVQAHYAPSQSELILRNWSLLHVWQESDHDGNSDPGRRIDSKPPSRHDIRYCDLYKLQSSFASKALDSSENDQPTHILCSTTKDRCNEEDGNDRKKNGVPTRIAYLSATNEHTTRKLPGRTNDIRKKWLMH